MIRDINSAFSPDQSVDLLLNFCSTAVHSRSACAVVARVISYHLPSSGVRIVLLDIKGDVWNVS